MLCLNGIKPSFGGQESHCFCSPDGEDVKHVFCHV